MFFRKSVNEKIDDITTKIRVSPDEFSDIPGLDCKIALDRLKCDSRPLNLDFAEAQLLTRELSKDCGINVRLPTLKEDYIAYKLNKRSKDGYLPEWKAEYIDGSFLMVNPEVRVVKHPRRYDFQSPFTLVETSRYSRFKDNGSSCWLGILRDQYDRAAFTSSSNGEKYLVGAVPPLSNDCSNVRLLIDENKQKKE